MVEALLHDVRFAFRHLRRSPGFALAAILTLAIGVGANTAMISVLNALLLRPLPIKDPHALIAVSGRSPLNQLRLTLIPAVDQLTHRDSPLQDVCGYNGGVVIGVEANGVAAQALGAFVTGQCFKTFGVTPALGRPILEADAPLDKPGNRVTVISHRLWTRLFGADASAVGKTIRTEGVELTIVGVAPEGFGGLHADSGADVIAPFDSIFPGRTDRRPGASHILGRLRPGVSLEQAAAALTTRWPSLLEAVVPATLSPAERTDLREARPIVERIGTGLSTYRERYARAVLILFALTCALLLLTGVNLGGLLLARLAARASELAVRLALGGSRWRIAQQMLVESLLLSLGGTALAIPISFAIVVALVSFLPPLNVERSMTFTPDVRVLSATAIVGLTMALLIAALPIWIAARRHATARVMWDRTIAGTTGRWAQGLVIAQVALSVVMAVGAGLLKRSLYHLQNVDFGVRPEHVLIVKAMPLPNAYVDIDNASYYPALLERLAAVPGVRSVGLSRLFPRVTVDTPGQPIAFVGAPQGNARAVMETVSPRFFGTVGIPLRQGRSLTWADNKTGLQVAVVNEGLARALDVEENVVGRRVRFGNDRAHQNVVVVGVVANATLGNPRRPDLPVFYRPTLQTALLANYPHIAIAVQGDETSVITSVRQVLQDTKREYVQDIASLADILTRAPVSERMSASLASALASLAVAIAVIGIYAVLAYSVSRRTREIGVRVAIGASPSAMVTMVLRQGIMLTLAGVAIGLPAAFLAARALRPLLFGISERDAIVFSAVTILFVTTALLATVVPARHAARVDPVIALRTE